MSAAARIRHLAAVPDPVAAGVEATPTAPPAPVRDEAVLVDVVVLTGDFDLFHATRAAVGERNPVWRARSAEEAADLLITGRCGVLLIDMASVSTRADTLIEQVVEQFPDVVVCVAGTREDEPLLVPLISDGLVYRFMHKPATARRAAMFLQAAIRRHVEHRNGEEATAVLPLLRSLARPSAGIPTRYLVGLGLLGLALGGLLLWDGDPAPLLTATPATAVTATVAPPAAATYGGRADPVLSRARAALQAGRLEAPEGRNALDLFRAVLLAQPEHAEARAGLARTTDLLVAQAGQLAEHGRKAEAERVLQRILAVDPRHEAATALLQQVNPPDLPSRQLAREQVARVRERAPAADDLAAPPVPVATAVLPTASAGLPEPVSARFRIPPATPAPTGSAVVAADPLAPRYVNTAPPKRVASWRRDPAAATARPLPAPLPTAGDERATTSTPVEAAPPAAKVLPADAFDRVYAPEPVYPAEALRTRTRGWVELEFTVAASGTVRDVSVIEAEPRGVFDAAASAALAQWRFRPRTVNGQPVAQRSTITLRFDVDG